MKKQIFNIIGMSCSACSAAVSKAVNNLDGIKDVQVNLLTNSMIVSFDDKILSEDKIIKAVEDAGYKAELRDKENKTQNTDKQAKLADRILKRLIISSVLLILLMIVSMGHMVGINLIPSENHIVKGITELLLVTPILVLNFKYFSSGFKALIRLNPNMDSLIAIGAAASVIYSVWQLLLTNTSHYYFESAGMILTFITIGKYLESKSKAKTTEAVNKLINLSPKTSIVIRDGIETEIDSKDIQKGDIVIVKSGMSFPADGVVTEGNGSADESAITGESMPVKKQCGSNVTGGTILSSGFIKFKALKVGEETVLSGIIKLVEDATLTKPKIAKLADKISRIFVPAVITIALLTAIIWYVTTESFETALNFGISVLVISCPCALGLATPTAIMVGTGKAAELGILVKSAEVFEAGAKVKTVMLDKTGTLTIGKPQVTDFITDKADKNKLIKICSKIESMSEHPLAKAISSYSSDAIDVEITDFKVYQSEGVSAKADGDLYLIGKKAFAGTSISHSLNEASEKLSEVGKTIVFVSNNSEVVAVIGISDKVKESSKEAIKLLNEHDINTIMLTGDNEATARHISMETGIKETFSSLMPADKNRIIREYQEKHPTAMVGDGINDSPALAAADVGIALGAGTDIAMESADLVLIKNDLRDVHTALRICKKVMQNIKENLFWALMYNTICIPIAAGALYYPLGLKLSPMIGTIAMSLSSICVISNALRLKRIKKDYNDDNRKEIQKMKTVNIQGMACPHCQARVTETLKPFDENVVVDHTKGTAIINDSVDNESIKNAIENAGYKFISIE
ncbi:MAG: heavy metal translocating P-type ATPase [Ruminococcaceae bacterium]|nr:heavy metal translocating P-type ATPase [Oscillospiraceae bacterium]